MEYIPIPKCNSKPVTWHMNKLNSGHCFEWRDGELQVAWSSFGTGHCLIHSALKTESCYYVKVSVSGCQIRSAILEAKSLDQLHFLFKMNGLTTSRSWSLHCHID